MYYRDHGYCDLDIQFKIIMSMESKRKGSLPKNVNRSTNKSNSKDKRSSSPAPKDHKKKPLNTENSIPLVSDLKKKTNQKLAKKKIQDLTPPQILIKVNYKGKRISIPIAVCDQRSLSDTILPHIVRFEHEILHNPAFNPGSISNWKTSGSVDILKDYYFQTSNPIKVFKGQMLQVEPIWKQKKIGKVQLNDFEIIKCIGTGGFSRVFLVRLKASGVFYALKLMEKDGLVDSGKECVVMNERNIMVRLKNPYIVNLQFAFETKHFVALALEYCPGGELFYYLRKIKRLTEDEARYCFLQILQGIQYLHSQNIIYRDIKPENIMIDMNGNLKIADFGLSREGLKSNELATTFCGSPQYMAPQMLAKSGHSYSIDYYCLGALLYQLVTGNPPFYSRDVDRIYQSIQNDEIDFPSHVDLSPEIRMLLESLLTKDPKRRLGSMGGIRQILGHPWVRKLKMSDVINKTVKNPVKIDLLTFNINEDDIEEGGDRFDRKFQEEGLDFIPSFEEFYFDRFDEGNVLEEVLASVKSQSTKQNKSLGIQYSKSSKTNVKSMNGFKSTLSREKNNNYMIDMPKLNEYPSSEFQRDRPKKLKKQRTKKQLNLIERAKRREQKSINRNVLEREKNQTHKSLGKGLLKRIKSSTALLGSSKRPK